MFTGWHDIKARKEDFYRTIVSTAQRAWEIEALQAPSELANTPSL